MQRADPGPNLKGKRELLGKIERLVAAHNGVSKSTVIAAALASFLSPDGEDQGEAAIAKRLAWLSRQFERLERDQNVLIETAALYIRYFLTVSIPVPEGQREGAREQGRSSYVQFIEQLARHIQRGRSLVREVNEDIGSAEAAEPKQPGAQGARFWPRGGRT